MRAVNDVKTRSVNKGKHHNPANAAETTSVKLINNIIFMYNYFNGKFIRLWLI